MVAFLADHPFDAGVDYHHGACAAGRHLAEYRGAFEWYAEACGLQYGVLLGVECAYAVLAD